jgi:hypothetical protein
MTIGEFLRKAGWLRALNSPDSARRYGVVGNDAKHPLTVAKTTNKDLSRIDDEISSAASAYFAI